jgi:hypothetical protein
MRNGEGQRMNDIAADHEGLSLEELGRRATELVPGAGPQPDGVPSSEQTESEPVDVGGDGTEQVIRQQPSGAENDLGGGGFPDRDAPASPAAPGSLT